MLSKHLLVSTRLLFKVGMLYGVAKASMEETGGGEGVEVLKNESYEEGEPLLNGRFTKGQYTDKIYHLESKVPAMIRYLKELTCSLS